jgi:cysteinyl-tRNA synthetase
VAAHLENLGSGPSVSTPAGRQLVDAAARAREQFRAAMDDDFNSAGAIGQMFELIKTYNVLGDDEPAVATSREGLQAVRDALTEFDAILGFFPDGLPGAGDDVPADITALVEERANAKKNKDFKLADELRDRMLTAGWVLEDTPGGVRVKKK